MNKPQALSHLYLKNVLANLNKEDNSVRVRCFDNGDTIEIEDTETGWYMTISGYVCKLDSDDYFGYRDVEFDVKNDSDLSFEVVCESVFVQFDKEFVKALGELTRRAFDFIGYNDIRFESEDY